MDNSHRVCSLVGSKNIASYRWRDSGDVDFFLIFFWKNHSDKIPRWEVSMYVCTVHTYMYICTKADVNLMYIRTGESPVGLFQRVEEENGVADGKCLYG